MRHRVLFWLLTISLVFTWVMPCHAIFDGDVGKAKEFMAAGMYPQAILVLDKRINEKPTDAEAHFQMGICYVRTGNMGGADDRFASAVKLDSDYGFKIGGDYKAAGSEALNKGDVNGAERLFGKAIKYQPNLKGGIAKEVMAYGKISMNDKALKLAYSLNSAYGKEISELFFKKGDASKGEVKINFYRTSKKFNSSFVEEMGNNLVSLAKDENTEKNLASEYKEVARDFISEEAWNEAFPPDFIIYQPSSTPYPLNLKAGEMTEKWVTFPNGITCSLNSADYKFYLIYPNGDKLAAWKLNSMPNRYKFKILAVTNQNIKMTVK